MNLKKKRNLLMMICVYNIVKAITREKTMEDTKIVELFWNRTEQAITETSTKYGNYLRTIGMNILKNYEDTMKSY